MLARPLFQAISIVSVEELYHVFQQVVVITHVYSRNKFRATDINAFVVCLIRLLIPTTAKGLRR